VKKLLTTTPGILALALGLLGQPLAVQAQALPTATPAAQGFSAERLQRLHAFAWQLTSQDGYLGAVTLVARHGRIVDWKAYGYRDLAHTSPMGRDSIFRMYSMTKTVATVAALMLMEEGRFALDDPVAKYLPEFAELKVFAGGTADAPQVRAPKRTLTIKHLMTHTAGFATGGPKEDEEAAKLFNRFDLHQSASLKDYAAYVARQPLARDPGTRFNYDGVNTEVMARVIEVIAGMPLDVFLQRRILTPLRMVDTAFSVPAAKRARVVDMVSTDADGKLQLAANAREPGVALNPYPSAAGGLYSTAQDYLRFAQMLANGGTLDGVTLLGRKTVDLMMQDQLGDAELPAGALRAGQRFGLGGYVVQDVARYGGLGSVGQFGWSGSGSTYYTIDRQEGLVAMLLLQHLPQGLPKDPPKASLRFYNLVYQALVR
jgi:CubicO group peptidase (beta-lactamase class C family)